MTRITTLILLIISSHAFSKVPEKEINAVVDTTFCSAFLEYIDSGVQYDQIKSHKLIKKAEKINSSLMRDYRLDVIANRSSYIASLKAKDTPKETAQAMYENLKCDLKI
jgi:hypothetical protein